jgi:hypothetical protein
LSSSFCIYPLATLLLPYRHPIDLLKVKAQVSRDVGNPINYHRMGLTRTIEEIYRHRGIYGFYQGKANK